MTMLNKYSIPVIQEMLDEFHGVPFFSKIDLLLRYHKIRVKNVPKTNFHTHTRQYNFFVMPFPLVTFQSTMNEIFRPHFYRIVLVFFDNILIYNKTWSDYLCYLKLVLQILTENQFMANKKKSFLGKS